MKYPGPVSGRGRARGGARRICDSVKCLSSGCHHEVPLTGWLMNNKNLLLTTLEAESLRSGCQHRGVLVSANFSLCPYMVRAERGGKLSPDSCFLAKAFWGVHVLLFKTYIM